jgi:hypothetical protein
MRPLFALALGVLLAASVFAQNRHNPAPVVTGGFPNVVYPGGTSATVPGLTRVTPNVVYPGGGGPHLYVPFASVSSNGYGALRNNGNGGGHVHGREGRGSGAVAIPYAYPVYVGGYYGDGLYDASAAPQAAQPAQQQGNVTVIYPPQPAPVIINQYGEAAAPPDAGQQPSSLYAPPAPPSDDTTADNAAPAAATEPTPYLLAFKDHTVYSAVAYWVDGDTLHYFTSGNTHNQVSLSLVDRDLTERLNKESGLTVKLPAPK